MCLGPKTPLQFGGPLCGNRVLEEGEQCDCGHDCLCCDDKCRLQAEAACGGGPCCSTNCTLKPSGALCREARGPCDLAELCTGTTQNCPEDRHNEDGIECGGPGSGHCYSGVCGSRAAQCRLLWGAAALPGPPSCNRTQLQGYVGGNNLQDQECGLLQCTTQGPPALFYGLGALTTVTAAFSGPQATQCISVLLGLEREGRDAGFVPNGSPCGGNSWCEGLRCIGDVNTFIT